MKAQLVVLYGVILFKPFEKPFDLPDLLEAAEGQPAGFHAKKEQSKGGKSQWAFCLTKDSGIGPSIDMQIEFCVICAFQ